MKTEKLEVPGIELGGEDAQKLTPETQTEKDLLWAIVARDIEATRSRFPDGIPVQRNDLSPGEWGHAWFQGPGLWQGSNLVGTLKVIRDPQEDNLDVFALNRFDEVEVQFFVSSVPNGDDAETPSVLIETWWRLPQCRYTSGLSFTGPDGATYNTLPARPVLHAPSDG